MKTTIQELIEALQDRIALGLNGPFDFVSGELVFTRAAQDQNASFFFYEKDGEKVSTNGNN